MRPTVWRPLTGGCRKSPQCDFKRGVRPSLQSLRIKSMVPLQSMDQFIGPQERKAVKTKDVNSLSWSGLNLKMWANLYRISSRRLPGDLQRTGLVFGCWIVESRVMTTDCGPQCGAKHLIWSKICSVFFECHPHHTGHQSRPLIASLVLF